MKGPDSLWRFGRDRADASHGSDPTEVLVQQLGGWTRRQKVHLAIWIVVLAVLAGGAMAVLLPERTPCSAHETCAERPVMR